MTIPWSVVIPSDSVARVEKSATSILWAHPGMDPSRIIVVTRAIVPGSLSPGLSRVLVVPDQIDQFNFSRRVNIGIERVSPADVVVMNDDVEVVQRSSFDLLADEAPWRVLASAVRGRVGPWWQREGNSFPEAPFVSFICVYLSRPLIEAVGPLDEGFPGYGCEDTDYCVRARSLGFSCGVSRMVSVEHGVAVGSSFAELHGERLQDMQNEAVEAFSRKIHGAWRQRGR